LDLLAERASSPRLRPVISQIRNRVREGKSLSEAVTEAGVFSKVYSTAILAGEKSGNLSGAWIITSRTSASALRAQEILATLVYPVLLVTVACIVVTYLVTVVIPKFALLYEDMKVPLPTPPVSSSRSLSIIATSSWEHRCFVRGRNRNVCMVAFGRRRHRRGPHEVQTPFVGDTILKFKWRSSPARLPRF